MSKIAKIKWNDTSNGPGIGVSLFVQGCPHHCHGCWNPETWDFEGGYEPPEDIIEQIIKGMSNNGIERCLNILGGEPLCEQNILFVAKLICSVRVQFKNAKIFLWTGYELSSIKEKYKNSLSHFQALNKILNSVDVIIDGPYIQELRDVSLHLRGSSNQKINYKNIDF